jgi:hypothetical protein
LACQRGDVHGLVDDHEVDAERLELGAVQKWFGKGTRAGIPASPAAPVKEPSGARRRQSGNRGSANVLTRMRKVARDSSLATTQSLGPSGRDDHQGRGLCRKASQICRELVVACPKSLPGRALLSVAPSLRKMTPELPSALELASVKRPSEGRSEKQPRGGTLTAEHRPREAREPQTAASRSMTTAGKEVQA